ncbi:cobalamin-binding protein [Falsibacillus pallidus]|uniref:Iron complex transport system substrate-binding protein n=1 Tax=Falsibacillus pallidus TaxID=493781 RepID=A0A370GEE9_9BACI|nr:cobalamin-binding protein [Falsibacillus pallidus]RDI41479.1 iron complex transport system substrate-binding protein [Falsibacillus pallidus]
MRLISICPSNTEILAYLDLTSQLIGVDDFSDWPASISSLPKLGPDLSIRMDDLEKLNPDLVLASLSVPGMEKNIEELQKRDIPHVVLDPQSLSDIIRDIRTVGDLCGASERASQVIEEMEEAIQSCRDISRTVEQKPSLYWEWWPKPVFTPGKTNWLTEISELAGAVNLFSDVELASVQTDWEDVLKRNPQCICLAWVGVHKKKINPAIVKKRPGWEKLRAVQENKIVVLEEALYCRPSPRLLEGLIHLAKLLHPVPFSEVELPYSLKK